MTAISMNVDDDVAQAFALATEEQRRKYEWKFNQKLRAAVWKSKSSLFETMDRISDNAAARGMTPEILDSILNDE